MVTRNRDLNKRMNYFDRQFLRAQDFTDEQDYHIDRHRRHNRRLHTPGIAEGLEATGAAGSTKVTVSAGSAIDAQGRDIILLVSQTVSMPEGTTSDIEIYITLDEAPSDPSGDPGVTGTTRITESPHLVIVPPDPLPPDGLLLTKITLNNGQLTAEPDNTVRTLAGTVVGSSILADNLTARSLTLKRDGIDSNQWPKLSCSEANEAALENGSLRLDSSLILKRDGVDPSQWPKLSCSQANEAALENSSLRLNADREIIFQGNGQMASSEDMLFLTGAPTPTEKMRILANGNVGIGETTNPEARLHIHSPDNDALKVTNTAVGKTLRIGVDQLGSWLEPTEQNSSIRLNASPSLVGLLIDGQTGNVGIGTSAPGAKLVLDRDFKKGPGVIPSALLIRHNGDSPMSPALVLQNDQGGEVSQVFLFGENSTPNLGPTHEAGRIIGTWHGLFVQSNGDNGVTIQGKCNILGPLTKPAGSFKIDHPLDPENRYLSHSFVESPDMKNVYDGVVVLEANGEALVDLPMWFTALNKDFRYQLTCIGGYAQVYIAKEIEGNCFKIAGGSLGLKVSWQLTGIRQDAWANAHRIPVEEDKSEAERGLYLYPEPHGQPENKGITWAVIPEDYAPHTIVTGENQGPPQ